MARYDKYDPISGGFRAPLAADRAKTSAGNPLGVGLDANGRVVPGGGTTGIVGVLCTTRDMKANDIVDVMTHGEVVEMTGVGAGVVVTSADASGVTDATVPGVGRTSVGYTVEATRLIVRRGAK